MFTTTGRAELLDELIGHARADPTVTAAAVVGSGARRQTDQWSDIDLALRLDNSAVPLAAADAWTAVLRSRHEVVDHLDVWAGPTLYRVFLLPDSLQVDLSFWPAADFGSTGEPFDLVFGEVNDNDAVSVRVADRHSVIGWAWLYALHTRSAIARDRRWQALQMLQGLRDQVVALACLRHGVPAHQGRGVDRLPGDLLSSLDRTLVAGPGLDGVADAFAVAIDLLLDQVDHVDRDLAARLRLPLAVLTSTSRTGARSPAGPQPVTDGGERPGPGRS